MRAVAVAAAARRRRRRRESAAAVLLQLLRLGEGRRAGACRARSSTLEAAVADADRAVGADRDVAVGRLQRDRAAVAEHLIAVGGDQLAGGVELQRAVAGVALAARRLHRQEAVAVDRDVERVAGVLGSGPGSCRARCRGRCTKLMRPSAPERSRARRRRYSSNSEPSALKPVVLMLAMLLATTSSSRWSAT